MALVKSAMTTLVKGNSEPSVLTPRYSSSDRILTAKHLSRPRPRSRHSRAMEKSKRDAFDMNPEVESTESAGGIVCVLDELLRRKDRRHNALTSSNTKDSLALRLVVDVPGSVARRLHPAKCVAKCISWPATVNRELLGAAMFDSGASEDLWRYLDRPYSKQRVDW